MVLEHTVQTGGGRVVQVFDTGDDAPPGAFTVLWHHGTPQTGALLDPLIEAAARRDVRLLSYARPGYGGSTPDPGRTVASAADDVVRIADALGVDRVAVMGASGGGPHALACAALLPDRVTAAVCLAGVAPFTTDFDWYAGMQSPDALRAATHGREARARLEETAVFDENSFTAADWGALEGAWRSLGADAGRAGAETPGGAIDDDVAYASPWGFDLDAIEAPVLLVQGGEDRVVPPSHAQWQLRQLPSAQLWLRPRDGHVSVLLGVPVALDWLRDTVRG